MVDIPAVQVNCGNLSCCGKANDDRRNELIEPFAE